jgi:aspartate/methionine/tyrosine aminotransferase
VDANLALLDEVFARRPTQLSWVRPRGGPVGFPEVHGVPVDRLADELLTTEGVLIAPASIFGHPGNRFRLGFGRTDLPVALAGLEACLDRTLGSGG